MNTLNHYLNRLCLEVLAALAPEDSREALIGDAIEMATSQQVPLWSNAWHSAWPLIALRLAGLRHRDVLLITGFVCTVALWEFLVARQWSWPIAQQFLPYSPLSSAMTCMAMYVLLYGAFALACGILIGTFNRTRWLQGTATTLLTATTLAPPILHLAFPTPVDSPTFRVIQLASIGLGLWIGRGMLHRIDRRMTLA